MSATIDESPAWIGSVAGVIIGASERRTWIELFFEGDLTHTTTVNLPAGVSDIYIEQIPHKTTVYEPPGAMILLRGPCDLSIARDGQRIIVQGGAARPRNLT